MQRIPIAADEYDLFVLRRAGDLAEIERERMAMIFKGGSNLVTRQNLQTRGQ